MLKFEFLSEYQEYSHGKQPTLRRGPCHGLICGNDGVMTSSGFLTVHLRSLPQVWQQSDNRKLLTSKRGCTAEKGWLIRPTRGTRWPWNKHQYCQQVRAQDRGLWKKQLASVAITCYVPRRDIQRFKRLDRLNRILESVTACSIYRYSNKITNSIRNTAVLKTYGASKNKMSSQSYTEER